LALALPILLVSGVIGWASIRQDERSDRLAETQVATVTLESENRLNTVRAILNVPAVNPSLIAGNIDDIRIPGASTISMERSALAS
jgi:hypothetical protein